MDAEISPTLAALQAVLAEGSSDALAAFWTGMGREGTPLIEPLDGGTQSLVTFLWQANEPVTSVAIIGGLGEDGGRWSALTRLGETDIWYKTACFRNDFRLSYLLSPNDPLTPFDQVTDWEAEMVRWQPDPLNPRRWMTTIDSPATGRRERVQSLLELPDAPPQPWIEPQPGTPQGRVERHVFTSAILGDEHRLFVYTPAGYDPEAEPYHLLLVFDGYTYIGTVPTPVILDNLIAARRIPPVVAVAVGNPSQAARNRYLPCYPPFAEFLATELIPWIRAGYRVTTDPARTVVAGSSHGGLASTFAALQYPELFGNVLSQSGSYFWTPEGDGEPEWLARQLAARPRLPIAFYQDIGLLEELPFAPRVPSGLMANRHFRDVLTARDYPLTYVEFMGGHDYACWRGTLADGLIALLGT
jgi:enterochelin esterase-like enzyme